MKPYSTSRNEAYLLQIIETKHALLPNSIRDLTDLHKDIPIVVINLSSDAVSGRASIPMKYVNENFTAKHLCDEFNRQFQDRCQFQVVSTRYEASVCNFVLKTDAVDKEKLQAALGKLGEIIEDILKNRRYIVNN